MSWWSIEVRSDDADADLVARELARLTGLAVEERPNGVVLGCAAGGAAPESIASSLRSRFGPALVVRLARFEPENWASRWRDGYQVHRVGRLSIGPSWLLQPGPDRLVIDPEMAFGTGEHGSTRSALALLDRRVRPGDRVIDLGSGSGVLAIAGVLLGARLAIGIDIDPEAEPIAAANARRNGVADRAGFLTGDAALLLSLVAPAELVAANTLRAVNQSLLAPVRSALTGDGTAVFAGMEGGEREHFLAPLAEAGFQPVEEVEDAGWWAVAARPA
jgi:ribosomal protein L11 methyltransferase